MAPLSGWVDLEAGGVAHQVTDIEFLLAG